MSRRLLAIIQAIWRVTWIAWSILVTVTLALAIIAIGVWEYQSSRAMDPDKTTLMPAPAVFAAADVDPFADAETKLSQNDMRVFYATGRPPAKEVDDERFYLNERSGVLRLGRATVTLEDVRLNWEDARALAISADINQSYRIRVDSIEEYGILSETVTPFNNVEAEPDPERVKRQMAEALNQKLSRSKHKTITIYVHGYKVVFENPLLLATELWHYTGYDGAFIAFAWPSTPNMLAYVSDIETTKYSARNLRILIEFLANETDAEKINIIGYSAGTHLVVSAMEELALLNNASQADDLRDRYRLGNVILVCSDIDRAWFGNVMADGAWKLSDQWIVYISKLDATLRMANHLFNRKRLGEFSVSDELTPKLSENLRQIPRLTIVDVSKAANVSANNGHAYFHKSPWVSSDLLMTLIWGGTPEERALVQHAETPIWEFPDDYLSRLKGVVAARQAAIAKEEQASTDEDFSDAVDVD